MREVTISKSAEKKIEKLLNYLEAKWSIKVRIAFARKLYNSVKIIKNNPESFPLSEVDKRQHRYVVTKQTTIYYTFTSKSIRITSVFDTRQHPNKIKKDL